MAPVRFLRAFLASPADGWQMLVVFLSESRLYPINQLARRVRFGSPKARNEEFATELSWTQFESEVLANRSDFLGVFIQEPVIPWAVDLYQRPQHIASILGGRGYLVIYRCYDDGVIGVREVARNVWITPRQEVSGISDAVHSFYSTSCAYEPSQVANVRDRARAIIYEYIDHIDPKISGDPERIGKLMRMFEAAKEGAFDYVACSAKALYQEMAACLDEEKLLSIPNGVDVEHYRTTQMEEAQLPNSYTEFIDRYEVIIGYFGAMAPWLWYEMLEELVAKRADVGFVFIGPDYYGGVQQLPKSQNVLWLDAVDYKILPAYARPFSVAIIPFEPGEIAQKTSPLKLFEYFALQKPVVCTRDMSECVQYKEVMSGDDVDSFSSSIDKAIELGRDSSFRSCLASLAEANDWRVRVLEIEKVFNK